MRLVVLLLVVASLSGCGGAVILQSRTDRMPEPVPVPAPVREVGRDEAIAVAVDQASHQRVTHTTVHKVDRHKDYWAIELYGVTRGGGNVRVRARVGRWSGEVVAYECQSIRGRARGHDRDRDEDDDDDHGHGHDREHDD